MKKIITLFVALSLPAFAGSGKQVVAEPEPSLAEWFAGGSIGYLLEFDEPMYHLHFGQDTGHQLGGWDFSWFLEIGRTEKNANGDNINSVPPGNLNLDGFEDFYANFDLEVMPITINSKFEKALTDSLTAYLGVGAGLANIDVSTPGAAVPLSGDDWVNFAQLFAGVIYDLNSAWELYGGARWMYIDEADINGVTLELDDDVLIELGLRRNF